MEMNDALPNTDLCKLSIEGCVANVTLTRSDVYNALNVQLISELIEIIEWTSSRSVGTTSSLNDSSGSPYLRAVVIRSEGKHFCAGADINMMRDAGASSPEDNRKDSERLDRFSSHCGRTHASQLGAYREWPWEEVPD